MPCFQAIKLREQEEYIRKNRKDINLYEGIEDSLEILKIMYKPKKYDPLINYINYPKTERDIYAALSRDEYSELKKYVCQLINEDEIDTVEKILTSVVCFTSFAIDDCLELLIKKGQYYPGIIFKDAAESIIDFLIQQVNVDKENRNHILLALAWSGNWKVAELFNKWRAKPPVWGKELYISPEKYSFEAGWVLSENGKRENVFFEDCYPLMHAKPDDEELLFVIKEHEDKCPWCNTNLTVLFDFDLTNPAFRFLNCHGTWLRIMTCHICTCYASPVIYTKIDFYGRSVWHKANRKPRYLPDVEPENETLDVSHQLVLSKTKRSPYYAAHWVLEVPANQIGGHPTWIQDAEYPVCPECSKHMKFIGQLDCDDFQEYGEGIYYTFLCKDCQVAAVSYQQT